MPWRSRYLKASIDPEHPDAPCMIYQGTVGDFVEGETIDVRMPDRKTVPGFIRAWIPNEDTPSRGMWQIQIRPLAEGSDKICQCLPVDGALLESPFCAYHSPDNEGPQ